MSLAVMGWFGHLTPIPGACLNGHHPLSTMVHTRPRPEVVVLAALAAEGRAAQVDLYYALRHEVVHLIL